MPANDSRERFQARHGKWDDGGLLVVDQPAHKPKYDLGYGVGIPTLVLAPVVPTVPGLRVVQHERAVRDLAVQLFTPYGGRLVPGWAIGVPDAALARRGIVSWRNVAGVSRLTDVVGPTVNYDDVAGRVKDGTPRRAAGHYECQHESREVRRAHLLHSSIHRPNRCGGMFKYRLASAFFRVTKRATQRFLRKMLGLKRFLAAGGGKRDAGSAVKDDARSVTPMQLVASRSRAPKLTSNQRKFGGLFGGLGVRPGGGTRLVA